MTADAAAQALVKIAKEIDPDGALARASFKDVPQTAEITAVDEELRIRQPDTSALTKYHAGMRKFLEKERTVDAIMAAVKKGHIWRGVHSVEESFATAIRSAFPFCTTPRKRVLLFLRSAGFWVAGETVSLEQPVPDAMEAVKECGTPVRLLVEYYKRLDVKLVLMNGSRNYQTWVPNDWDQRGKSDKLTVILNVWSHHVSTYKPSVADNVPAEGQKKWHPVELAMERDEQDKDLYDDMEELEFPLVVEAMQQQQQPVFWTTMSADELEKGLKAHDISYLPHYTSPTHLNLVTIPYNIGKHKAFIRIRRVPEAKEDDAGKLLHDGAPRTARLSATTSVPSSASNSSTKEKAPLSSAQSLSRPSSSQSESTFLILCGKSWNSSRVDDVHYVGT